MDAAADSPAAGDDCAAGEALAVIQLHRGRMGAVQEG